MAVPDEVRVCGAWEHADGRRRIGVLLLGCISATVNEGQEQVADEMYCCLRHNPVIARSNTLSHTTATKCQTRQIIPRHESSHSKDAAATGSLRRANPQWLPPHSAHAFSSAHRQRNSVQL